MRPSTLSKEWRELLEQVGGVNEVAKSLGMSPSTFGRAARGETEFKPEKKEALEILCGLYKVKNPLRRGPKPWAKDLTSLKLLGMAIARDMPISNGELDKLRLIYPTDQLTALSKTFEKNVEDNPELLLACRALLEED